MTRRFPRMDTVTLIGEGVRIALGFLNLLLVPGLVLSLVLYPRFTDMGLIQRLAYSTVLSISSVISLVLFMDVVLGIDTTPRNISIVLGVFSASMLLIWLCEIWYLSSSLPARLHTKVAVRYQAFERYLSRIVNSRKDRFAVTSMTRVLWHENVPSGRNHVDHSYLIDVSDELDIHQVDENKWKISEAALLPPPYPRTQYFELVIREFREDGQSLVDDINVYPVNVTKGPVGPGLRKQRGALKIAGRIYEKTGTSEIQWIYSHDFHLFPILYPEDTLRQIVNRVVAKLDEIATSVRSGSRVSSHVEDTQKLMDEFEIVLERPRRAPAGPTAVPRRPEPRISAQPTEGKPGKLPERPRVVPPDSLAVQRHPGPGSSPSRPRVTGGSSSPISCGTSTSIMSPPRHSAVPTG